jgi:dihydroorotate dehydrogenase (NAD+) catalytic subunit
MEFGTDPKVAAEVTSAVKKSTSLPVIVKLSPNVTDIGVTARVVADSGADALCLINTVRGMAVDVNNRRPALGNIVGGLSGPAIKPIALYMVYRVAGVVDIPIIGCGGITCGDDALEFLMAGASAVQVGTANLADPQAALKVLDGIERFMKKKNCQSLKEGIGVARG